MTLIAIQGAAGSGKDTLANFMVDNYGLTQLTFATPMKQFLWRVFDFSQEQLWGPSKFRDQPDHRYNVFDLDEGTVDSAWAAAYDVVQKEGPTWVEHVFPSMDISHYKKLVDWFDWLGTRYHASLTPRIALQSLGDEWGRHKVDKDMWVDYILNVAKRKIQEGATGIIISDIRYANELKAIKAAGGKILHISRPETDDLSSKVGINSHPSEIEQKEFKTEDFDFLVSNDGTISDLYADVRICATCLGLVSS